VESSNDILSGAPEETHQQRAIPDSQEFKYRLDFYYQQALVYLITLIIYTSIRGTIAWNHLPALGSDPILYIIALFALNAIVTLILNKIRDRKLIIAPDRLVFHHKYNNREIEFANIEWMYVGRERMVQTAGKYQVVVFKILKRRRLFRIRIGRYERADELLNELRRIAEGVPKIKRTPLRMKMAQLGKSGLRERIS